MLRPNAVAFLHETDWTDSIESGGGIFGYRNGSELVIEEANHASGPVRSSRHPDLQHDVIVNYAQRLEDYGLYWCGTWHTHPTGSGNASTGDCVSMAAAAGATRETENIVVGLILTDPGWGSAKPAIKAWIADGHLGAPVRIGPACELFLEQEPIPLCASA